MDLQIKPKTDKFYWHRYMPEYERLVFRNLERYPSVRILEWGVLDGESIRFLSSRFPEAKLVGIDIVDKQPRWPFNDNIEYFNVNQGDKVQVSNFYSQYNRCFDLIIDDGSHEPRDQAVCLYESFNWIKKGGYYIAEDLHSNFMLSELTPLKALLALKHLKEINADEDNMIAALTTKVNDYITMSMLRVLYTEIDDLHFFRRACLPLECWSCHRNNFDYKRLTCECGVTLYGLDDSLTCIIKKKM